MDDERFVQTLLSVERRLQLLDRVPRVRVKSWLAKLGAEATNNAAWRRNRNAYASLLLEQLRAGVLEPPFNVLPPPGGLPTLPAHLAYRFMRPPKQAVSEGGWPGATGRSSCASGPPRPRSAGPPCFDGGDDEGCSRLQPGHVPRPQHASWALHAAAAPPPRHCGSPPRRSLPDQQVAFGSDGGRSTCSWQRRPRSPGAAGLLDAAASLAAEVEAGRDGAQLLESRLRFAEDKILQQEAELVRLQGQAATARRRIRTATATTLGELLERYGGAAWSGSAQRLSAPGGGGVGEAVYAPVWQLLSAVQSALDACDEEDRRDRLAAQGPARARCEARHQELAAAAAQEQLGSSPQRAQPAAGAAAAAASDEAAALKQLKALLTKLQQHAEALATELHHSREAATAAAGGGPVTAQEVAAAAAAVLQPMHKSLRRAARDAARLRKHVGAAASAAEAAGAAAAQQAAALASHSDGDSDDGSDSSSNGGGGGGTRAEAQRRQQQQQQARLQRLGRADRLLDQLEEAVVKLGAQLADGTQRFSDIAASAAQPHGASSNGLTAAATAGAAAALAAGGQAFQRSCAALQQELKQLRSAAKAGSDGGLAAADSPSSSHGGHAGDAALAGTWAAASPRTTAGAACSPPHVLMRSPSRPASTGSNGGSLAALSSAGAPGLLSKSAFAGQLSAPVAAKVGVSAAADVHQRLSSLSRQASSISARASQLLGPLDLQGGAAPHSSGGSSISSIGGAASLLAASGRPPAPLGGGTPLSAGTAAGRLGIGGSPLSASSLLSGGSLLRPLSSSSSSGGGGGLFAGSRPSLLGLHTPPPGGAGSIAAISSKLGGLTQRWQASQ